MDQTVDCDIEEIKWDRVHVSCFLLFADPEFYRDIYYNMCIYALQVWRKPSKMAEIVNGKVKGSRIFKAHHILMWKYYESEYWEQVTYNSNILYVSKNIERNENKSEQLTVCHQEFTGIIWAISL